MDRLSGHISRRRAASIVRVTVVANLCLALFGGCSEDLPMPHDGQSSQRTLDAVTEGIDVVAPRLADASADDTTLDVADGDANDDGTDSAPRDQSVLDSDLFGDTVTHDTSARDTSARDTSGDGDATRCSVDADCDDGDPCTGMSGCDVATGTCVVATPPDDGSVFCLPDGTLVTCDGMGGGERTACPEGCNAQTGMCRRERIETWGDNSDDTWQMVTEDFSNDDAAPSTNYDEGQYDPGHELTSSDFLWLRFDISALPQGAELKGATLELTVIGTNDEDDGDCEIAVAVGADTTPARDWVETSGDWETYDGSTPWTGGSDGGWEDRGTELARIPVAANAPLDPLVFELREAGLTALRRARSDGRPLTLFVSRVVFGHDRIIAPAEHDDGTRPRLTIRYLW